ncbi:MAG: ATP-binding protein [Candidatus Omnitrophica bacterium]|nr:ATP-binding protein [Candidatus Omnitrophota bacterium]
MKNKISSADSAKKSQDVLYPPQGWDQSKMGDLTMDELARSNKELEQFAFLAAHDLQEPLRAANSYTQLLARKYRGKLDDHADKILSSILESTERMQKLIQSLLKYSQAGKGNIQLKELDSNIVLQRAIENLKVNIEESSAQIRYNGCPVIRGDEVQLMQLFQNLIHNSIKFRKKEDIPHIHISARLENNHWVFSVQDNGIGIEPEYTKSVFDLFRRLHTQSEYLGSGIGLSLCKRIVESHQGKIWVESETGEGTTVCFTIPKTEEL